MSVLVLPRVCDSGVRVWVRVWVRLRGYVCGACVCLGVRVLGRMCVCGCVCTCVCLCVLVLALLCVGAWVGECVSA